MELVMPNLGDASVWMSFITLTFLEIVLGIDNIIFITIAANKLPEEERPRATNIGHEDCTLVWYFCAGSYECLVV
jgi:predicted tellurium resistance membrane protein TerC